MSEHTKLGPCVVDFDGPAITWIHRRDDKPLRLIAPLVRAQQMARTVRGPSEWAMSWPTFRDIWLSVEDGSELIADVEQAARDGRRTLLGWRVHIDDTIDGVKVMWAAPAAGEGA